MTYDIAVVGGGPGGYVAAIRAAQSGKKTCLIEKGEMGGVCLNAGCIPTKVLLKSVETLKSVRMAASYGITNLSFEKAELDMDAVQKRRKSVITQLTTGVSMLLQKKGVEVFYGTASFVEEKKLVVGEQTIEAHNIIVATGSKAIQVPLDSDSSIPIYTSNDVLQMEELPKSIVVIGGGVVGIELAYYLKHAGSQVHVVEYMDQVLPMIDHEIAGYVEMFLQELGVGLNTSAKAIGIVEKKVVVEKNGSRNEIPCNAVLMSVGRAPNTEGLNLDVPGIKTHKGAILTDAKLETNVPGIYAVGDVNGKSMLAHTASAEAVVAVENICGIKSKMDYYKIPNAVYIQPELASVGLTEREARSKYGEVNIGRFSMADNGKAVIDGENQGLIKIITEPRYGEIVGAHFFCTHATDMIGEMSLAGKLECTASELVQTIHPHPTMSEALHEACQATIGKAIHSL